MKNSKTQYRVIVANENGGLEPLAYPTADKPITTSDFIAQMEVAGFEFAGFSYNERQREELQGQPKFKGLCGAMFDGDAIRYESPEANAILSA